MARELTDNERHVLAHVVVDPDEWWEHATERPKINEEAALAAKVERHQADHDAECVKDGYCTRAVKQAAEDARQAQVAIDAKVAGEAAVVVEETKFNTAVADAVAVELTKRGL